MHICSYDLFYKKIIQYKVQMIKLMMKTLCLVRFLLDHLVLKSKKFIYGQSILMMKTHLI